MPRLRECLRFCNQFRGQIRGTACRISVTRTSSAGRGALAIEFDGTQSESNERERKRNDPESQDGVCDHEHEQGQLTHHRFAPGREEPQCDAVREEDADHVSNQDQRNFGVPDEC